MIALSQTWREWRDVRLLRRSGVFNEAWYLRRYQDVAQAGVDPVLHYVQDGVREGRFPNPLFDTAWYVGQYMSRNATTINPLADYLRQGAARGRRPNRWFDPVWYSKTHDDRRSSVDPLVRYITQGARDGHDPSPGFAIAGLQQRYPDLADCGTPLGFYIQHYRVTVCLGDCTAYYISGWASRPTDPDQISLTVRVNGQEQGRITPWLARPDVGQATGLTGFGFFFEFPTRLANGDLVDIRDEFDQSCNEYKGLGDLGDGCTRSYAVPPLGTSTDLHASRAAVAATFLVGYGVEIGAYTQPTDLPPDRRVVFFDRQPAAVLRQFYDEACHRPLMNPAFVGEAETLAGLPDATFDFVIANHVIEHLEDPVQFLEAVTAKLVEGGRVMIAAPDKRFSFDHLRPLTSFDHLVEDHERGPARSRADHFQEWAILVQGLHGQAATDWIDAFDLDDMPIHFHVWDAASFVTFTEAAIDRFQLPLRLLYSCAAANEVIVVCEKRLADHESSSAARSVTQGSPSTMMTFAGKTALSMQDINDRYVATGPSDQNAIDLFKGQWISGFPGTETVVSGGAMPLYADPRIDWLIQRLGSALKKMNVAELGPFEAGHSYMLHKAGAKQIVAVEGHALSYFKSLVAKEVFNLTNLSLRYGEIEQWLTDKTLHFDLLVASGVLYHFKDPLYSLYNMSRMAKRIFIWTHYVHHDYMPAEDQRWAPFTGEKIKKTVEGVECFYYMRSYRGAEKNENFCGGIHADSVWLDHHSIVRALNTWGFKVQEILAQIDHPSGPASCFYAWRPPAS